MISWAITVCNEDKELDQLLADLVSNINPQDEIVIQADSLKVTKEVKDVIADFSKSYPIKFIEFPLNMDFASFKNNLKSSCKGDYIYQIDADEMVSTWMISNLEELLSHNPTADLIWVPRINIVDGITPQYITENRWNLNSKGYINYPDYQSRIIKNKPEIHWENKVHEVIKGHKVESKFPLDMEGFELIHVKSFDKQVKQNEFYSQINQK
jgi:hypothetical protein